MDNNAVNNAVLHYVSELSRMSLSRFSPGEASTSEVHNIVAAYVAFLQTNEQDLPYGTDATCEIAIDLINWHWLGDNFSEYAQERLVHFRDVAARRAFAARNPDF